MGEGSAVLADDVSWVPLPRELTEEKVPLRCLPEYGFGVVGVTVLCVV